MIRTIEEQDEKLVMYEEKVKKQGVNSKGVKMAEQKVGDIIIYFEKHASALENQIQEADLALEDLDIEGDMKKKARHDINLAENILSYLEREINEMKQKVGTAENLEGREEINELEEIEAQDEKVLERIRKMFEGSGQFRDDPDYGWISLS